MRTGAIFLGLITISMSAVVVMAYPPAVGILGESRNCLACHVNNGPWTDSEKLVIDLIDNSSGVSLAQADGTFILTAKRGEAVTIQTIIGYETEADSLIPYRHGWLYIDPRRIGTSSISKFPAGWEVNLPMACRLVGDKLESRPGVHGTALPMTVRPTDAAEDADVTLQLMLTNGGTVKGDPTRGMTGSYFERTLHLKVDE